MKLPFISKDSLRLKVEDLKKDSELIMKSDNLSLETRMFIKSMLVIIDVVVATLLLKKVRKTSSNSGVPSSQNFGSNGNRKKPGDSETDKKGG